ncbi:MAG: hypothetical protein ABI369_13145 [Acetobacteraceae bacterium]
MTLPAGASRPSGEAIREWFRRTHGREPTEREVEELQETLAPPEPGKPAKEP